MLVNETVIFPEADTLEYLNQVFQDCPFTIDLSLCHVTLNETWDACSIDPSAIYEAKAGTLGYWYDDSIEGSSLILPLESPSIITRMNQLRQEKGYVFHKQPLAFMVLQKYMPPLSRRNRNFVISVSEILYNSEHVFKFTGETQRLTDIDKAPYDLYYQDNL